MSRAAVVALITLTGAMLLSLVLLAMLLFLGSEARAQPAEGTGGDVVPGQFIVALEDDVSPREAARDMSRRYDVQVSHVYEHALNGFAGSISGGNLSAVRGDGRVRRVIPDRKVEAFEQTLPTGVDRIEGDTSSTQSGDGTGSVDTAVAIIDTGIDVDHPDLNVVGGKNCSTGSSYDDGNGHGTHVAGTVAAKDDGAGVVGVAPGAPLYAVRVLDNTGSGTWASVICGIDWVTANAPANGGPIEAANMSLGGGGSDGSCTDGGLREAICNSVNRGVTYAVAAGNGGGDLKGFVPATYDEVLTVTAVADFNGQPGGGAAPTCRSDVDDTAADFSNYPTVGSIDEGHTIAAPGVCIRSTWKGGGYNTISGTSMASPHVAGAAALCIATSATTGKCTGGPADVKADLRADAANKSDPLVTPYYGYEGDPNDPITKQVRKKRTIATITLYYGYLAYRGDY